MRASHVVRVECVKQKKALEYLLEKLENKIAWYEAIIKKDYWNKDEKDFLTAENIFQRVRIEKRKAKK